MKTKTSSTINSMNRSSRHCGPVAGLLITLVLACFALSPTAQAVCQDGCGPSNNDTFLGDDALIADTFGFDNTATGAGALESNTSGYENTASGSGALAGNIIGIDNTATGFRALGKNDDGSENTAAGSLALFKNTTGFRNTAIAAHALESNTTGIQNTALGFETLLVNKTGSNNTAVGLYALFQNTGSRNTAVGVSAGFNLTTGHNNIDIGDRGVAAESNTIRIGNGDHTNTFIAGISGVTIPGGVGVIIDTSGHLGTVVSSERFKDNVQPMDKASEAILALQPVTFRYKHELDPAGIPQFGLVAEQVAKVNPDLVARDGEGKPYTVRYEAVNAMLLNEFLKEHRKVEEQAATTSAVKSAAAHRDAKVRRLESIIAEQQKQIASLTESLKQQAAEVRKISTRLETERSTPRLIADK